MGIQFSDDVTIPQSTGVVQTPAEPVVTEQTPGHPQSTDAVPGPETTVMSIFGPSGQEPTGAVETPGPVTIRNSAVKVVRPPTRGTAAAATTAESPESTSESRREARAAERAAQASDADPDSGR